MRAVLPDAVSLHVVVHRQVEAAMNLPVGNVLVEKPNALFSSLSCRRCGQIRRDGLCDTPVRFSVSPLRCGDSPARVDDLPLDRAVPQILFIGNHGGSSRADSTDFHAVPRVGPRRDPPGYLERPELPRSVSSPESGLPAIVHPSPKIRGTTTRFPPTAGCWEYRVEWSLSRSAGAAPSVHDVGHHRIYFHSS